MWGSASPSLSSPDYESKSVRLPEFTKLTSQGYATPARNGSFASMGYVSLCKIAATISNLHIIFISSTMLIHAHMIYHLHPHIVQQLRAHHVDEMP